MIIKEATKMRPYLNFMKDKEVVINVEKKIYTTVKGTLDGKPIDTTHNTINFLNTLSKKELKTVVIRDRIVVITWERKIIGKHYHIESVQEKADQM